MATYIQKAVNNLQMAYTPSTTTLTLTFSSTTTSSNAIVVYFGVYSGGGTPAGTISDAGGHSWTIDREDQQGSTGARLYIAHAFNITGQASHWVRFTSSVGALDMAGKAVEVSGIDTLRTANSTEGTTSTISTGGLTSTSGDFVLAACSDESGAPGAITWSGSTELGADSFDRASYKIATGGSEAPTWTNGANWVGGIAAYYQSAVPPDYGTPRDHEGVAPWSSIWRPGRV